MRYLSSSLRIRKFLLGLGQLALGFAIAYSGQLLSFLLWVRPSQITSIWIPGAILLPLLIASRHRAWGYLAIGFAIGGGTAFCVIRGTPAWLAYPGYSALTACIVGAAFLLRVPRTQTTLFPDTKGLYRFFLVAIGLLPIASALVYTCVALAAGIRTGLGRIFILALPTYAAGYMLFTPLLFGLLRYSYTSVPDSPRKSIEFVLLALGVLILPIATRHLVSESVDALPLLLFSSIPLLLLAAVRHATTGTAICLVLAVVPATWFALYADGSANPGNKFIYTHILQFWIIAMGMLIHAISIQAQSSAAMMGQLRKGRIENQSLASRLINSQESERARISRELHDGVNQQIASAAISLSAVKRGLDAADGRQIESIRGSLIGVIDEIRGISRNLHPALLKHVGLVAAIESIADDLHGRWEGLIDIDADPDDDWHDPRISFCFYRIAQESIRNAIDHSGTDRIHVQLSQDSGSYALVVEDHGSGFDPAIIDSTVGLGLVSMRERAQQLRGNLVVDTAVGKGTRICISIPKRPQ